MEISFIVGEAALKTEDQIREDAIREDMLAMSPAQRHEMAVEFDKSEWCKTRTATKEDFEFARKRVSPSALAAVACAFRAVRVTVEAFQLQACSRDWCLKRLSVRPVTPRWPPRGASRDR